MFQSLDRADKVLNTLNELCHNILIHCFAAYKSVLKLKEALKY